MRAMLRMVWRWFSLLALMALAMFSTSCANCGGFSARRSAVKVRWPATARVDLEQALRATAGEPPASVPGEPLPDNVPGVRVREGMAHDLYFLEIVLGDADFEDALPLVVLLHGRGDRPRIPGGPFGGVPTPIRLIVPRGPQTLGQGFAWLQVSITHGKPDLLASSLRARADHLAALIDTLRKTRPTLGQPVVAGFSQGAMLTFALALHRPDVVGVALPMAGWVPPRLMPAAPVVPERRVPIRSLHGMDDPVVPIAPTRDVAAQLRALGWEVDLLEFEGVAHVISREMNVRFEAWLEEALRAQAPSLTGKGLGQVGPEDEAYEPWEPLDTETLQAIEQFDDELPTPPVDESPDARAVDDATVPRDADASGDAASH